MPTHASYSREGYRRKEGARAVKSFCLSCSKVFSVLVLDFEKYPFSVEKRGDCPAENKVNEGIDE